MFGKIGMLTATVYIVLMAVLHPQQIGVDGTDNGVVEAPITKGRSITIEGNDFMLDGQQLHIVSGSLHYFRAPAAYWEDRLQKLKAAGLNSVATYVEWSYHEPEYRQYRFSGDHDLAQFVRQAAAVGLHVLLRPGPYICAERDLGGLPYWLLSKYPNIKLRTTDENFINETRTWMAELFKQMTPLLYGNGGPIILVQVENEYGSYGKDMEYKEQIRDIIKQHVGDNALLYTTDGSYISMVQGGAVPETLTTIDFGVDTDVRTVFGPLRIIMPQGPLMNSEFYPGWLTHWGEQIRQVPTAKVVKTLRDMLDAKINVNMYMFFGGTNFEFSAGGNSISSRYLPDITSYDYDAPLSEAGDPTPKYYAIRDLLKEYNPDLRNTLPPLPSRKGNYGEVAVSKVLNLLSLEGRNKLGKICKTVMGSVLPTFEALGQRSGMVLYETVLPLNNTSRLIKINKPRDRVYVYIDGVYIGVICRTTGIVSLPIPPSMYTRSAKLSLLVENLGRINFGPYIHDFKGIRSEVYLGDQVLGGKWKVTGYPLEDVDVDAENPTQLTIDNGPLLYRGYFRLPNGTEPLDTFLDTSGWRKGYVWINGHNLGRYWPSTGPQVTLYLPGVWLRGHAELNTIEILELEQSRPSPAMTFIDYPILNATATKKAINPNTLIFNI